jgi:hypothetical protein
MTLLLGLQVQIPDCQNQEVKDQMTWESLDLT